MTQPTRLAPTFATAPGSTTRDAAPEAPPRADAHPLAGRLARLSAEQLDAVESLLDALERGAPAAPAPLEVLATRWWFPMDVGHATQPVVIQRVRGLAFTVVQIPEHGRLNGHLIGAGYSLATHLRAAPDALTRWFAAGTPASQLLGSAPSAFSAHPLPVPPWTGYAPRVEVPAPQEPQGEEPARRRRA